MRTHSSHTGARPSADVVTRFNRPHAPAHPAGTSRPALSTDHGPGANVLPMFARLRRLPSRIIDLNVTVTRALLSVGDVLGPDILITRRLLPQLPAIHAERWQVNDLVRHLVEHAALEMPDGGMLTVITDVATVGPQMRRAQPFLPAGRFVRLEIGDSGRGMPPEVTSQLFQPFFSLTPEGERRLSLFAAYGIVRQMGGFIWADSEPRQGTRVHVLLPPAHPSSAYGR